MRYEPQREKRYNEITAAGKQHDPSEVIKAVLADLVLAEHCLRERDAVIRELVEANLRARQPGHVSDVVRAIEQRDKIEAKALALIGGEKGE